MNYPLLLPDPFPEHTYLSVDMGGASHISETGMLKLIPFLGLCHWSLEISLSGALILYMLKVK